MDELEVFCGRVLGPGASAEQAAAQARSRQRVRSERRGTAEPGSDRAERDRSLRVLAWP